MPDSDIDFLFEGKPPQSVTTEGQTVEGIPKWMSDYTQGLIARANASAAEPYIPYGGPRIAGFSPEQQAAFGMTEANMGSYMPYLEGAASGYGGGLGRAANISRAAQPYLDAGSKQWTDEGVADSYMSPYIGNVLDRQEDLATRTLEEEFMPRLSGMFGGAGQYGSRGGTGSMEDIAMRGGRDIQEGLEAQRLEALHGAYGQGADIFAGDMSRQGELGRIAGALEEAGAASMYQGAEGLTGLGSEAQRMGLTDAAAMEGIGAQQQGQTQRSMDLAYQDFLEQRNLPFDRVAFMNAAIRGLPMDQFQTRTDYGPASIYQPSPLSQIVGAYGVYRGMNPGDGSAEGGYIEGDYDDVTDYAEGGYAYPKAMAEGGYIPEEYSIGGLATAAWKKMYGLGKSAWGGLSAWAQNLRPDTTDSIGVLGGHTLANENASTKNIELKWKQD
jgi:hypothetical protein